MKTAKLLIACLLFAVSGTIHAQWVSIPNAIFADYLNNNGFGTCMQYNNTTLEWEVDTFCVATLPSAGLYCSNLGITDFTGVQYLSNVTDFDCSNNPITFLPDLPVNLTSLACGYSSLGGGLTQLPLLPPTLLSLSCEGQALTSLPDLPAGMVYLSCHSNAITTLPNLPSSLTVLDAPANQLTEIPALPPVLQSLRCGNNLLTDLPTLPSTLYDLWCEDNQLTALPNLPTGLTELKCYNNQLTALPALPTALTRLDAGQNQFTTLPQLPSGLTYLWIPDCQITAFPTLPASLLTFNCNANQCTQLPALPNGLRHLQCSMPTLNVLPAIPSSLLFLGLYGSPVTSLPTLPDSLDLLEISGSQITCLPQLKKIRRFYFSAMPNLTCLPNYPLSNTTSVPALNTIPLCNYSTSTCPVFYNISGKVYTDANNNCVADAGETSITNVKVLLWSNSNVVQQVVTNNGFYSFDITAFGTYQITVDTVNMPFRIKCPSSGSLTSVITGADSLDFDMNFAVECKPGFDLEARSVSSSFVFRPANYTPVEVSAGDATYYYATNCAAGVSGSVTLSFTGPAKFISAAPNALTPTVAGNTLTYNIANFGTVNFFEDFDIIVQTDTTAQAGQQVCFTLNVTPSAGDNNPANNTFSICYTVVNSYDPNDKQVSPSGNIDTAQRELVYTIRFQNTGNAEAQHIYITDTLSSSINPASFQLLAYSHQPMVQLDGNKLRFNFPNINLPDSTTNEPASHGYVQFKVKLNNSLPVGSVINNTAFIYFDFNAPVVTNTTTNTIYVPAPPAIKPISIGKYRIDRGVKPNGRL